MESQLVLPHSLQIALLEPVLSHTSLLLKQALSLQGYALLFYDPLIVFGKPLLEPPLLLNLLLLRNAGLLGGVLLTLLPSSHALLFLYGLLLSGFLLTLLPSSLTLLLLYLGSTFSL
ncbi:MAG TPA: hypothetical protein VFF31_33105 [Blastocatellia bacterium]|nr:hypothetical protein [Blastocatellia bacterium]